MPNGRPVAFRMPCCDSMNSPSPRFFSELFNDRSPSAELPDDRLLGLHRLHPRRPGGPARPGRRAGRHAEVPEVPAVPFTSSIRSRITRIPYLIDRLCWEFPCVVPSDWEAQNLHGEAAPKTLEDWKRALDAVVIKQGVFTAVFHPYGWIAPEQVAAFVDYADRTYAGRVRFLTFREAQERLDAFLLGGQPVRDRFGRDNGVRLLDLDDDGYHGPAAGRRRPAGLRSSGGRPAGGGRSGRCRRA